MKKKQKNLVLGISITLLVLIMLGAGYFFTFYNPAGQSFIASEGCNFISGTATASNSAYTEVKTSTSATDNGISFTCDKSECYVHGAMTLEKSSAGNKVVFRTVNTNYGVSANRVGLYESYSTYSSYYYPTYLSPASYSGTSGCMPSLPTTDIIATTPQGYPIVKSSTYQFRIYDKVYPGACTASSPYKQYMYNIIKTTSAPTYTTPSLSTTPLASCQTTESCISTGVSGGTFNFCPPTSQTQNYCTGTGNSVTPTQSNQIFTTNDIRLLSGETIIFDPQYIDKSRVAKKELYISKYDCTCVGNNICDVGEFRCINTTAYKSCGRNINDPSSCFDYITLKSVSATEYCDATTNTIKPKPTGCAYDTAGTACSTQKDANNILLEKCDRISSSPTYNKCVPVSDSISASPDDYRKTICSQTNPNMILIANKYVTPTNTIYRWEISNNSANTRNGVCNSGYFCDTNSIGNAICLETGQLMSITSSDNYAVNQKIGNITIQMLVSDLSTTTNLPVIARLFDSSDNEVSRLSGTTINAQGQAKLNFNYAHPRSEQLKIVIVVGDPSGLSYESTKNINIAKALSVKLNCPTQAIVLRDIICTWKVVDEETNSLLSSSDILSITQGTTQITDYQSTINSVTFQASKSGSVEVKVSSKATDYLDSFSKAPITIQDPSISQLFEIDSKSYEEYINGVSKGVHRLQLTIEESGLPAQLSNIDAKITIPSGREEPLILTQDSSDKTLWTASYDFLEAGKSYTFSGNIIPSDISKKVVPFEYKIATTSSTTEDLGQQISNVVWIVAGVVVAIIFLIVMVILLTRKKRR